MALLRKKKNARRTRVRKNINAERVSRIKTYANTGVLLYALIFVLFAGSCIAIFRFNPTGDAGFNLFGISLVVVLISAAMASYLHQYQKRILRNRTRAIALAGMFVVLLATEKLGIIALGQVSWATGTAVAAAIILAIAYDQRFALGMSLFYCVLACFSEPATFDMGLFLTMSAAAVTCIFSLGEIRTRMKLLEVGAMTAAVVLVISVLLGYLLADEFTGAIFKQAGLHALSVFLVLLVIQSLLPVIEKAFHIATSMTLLDYSDANQPLLKRLAMEAPGTFSHSLMVGSVAEAAAESIGRNGLLCRVGAYYHDIGKINKPGYFIENEMGGKSRHGELSPAMSQLIIVGHVKDGSEMAKEYGVPAVIRQFIETHHGTTLVEYFYNQAKKNHNGKASELSENEFRYAGPKPRTKEAAIVMLADAVEGAVRSLEDVTAPKIETVVHNMAMKRLQDGQFDECDLSLRELHTIEASISKALAAHYHGRIAYPTDSSEGGDGQLEEVSQKGQNKDLVR